MQATANTFYKGAYSTAPKPTEVIHSAYISSAKDIKVKAIHESHFIFNFSRASVVSKYQAHYACLLYDELAGGLLGMRSGVLRDICAEMLIRAWANVRLSLKVSQ